VLGVAFDPLNEFIISFGLDRRACVWKKCSNPRKGTKYPEYLFRNVKIPLKLK
jgi:hypothetical protein